MGRKASNIEFLCHLCNEWVCTDDCIGHFEHVHTQNDVTFEKLTERLSIMGGVNLRNKGKIKENSNEETTQWRNFPRVF